MVYLPYRHPIEEANIGNIQALRIKHKYYKSFFSLKRYKEDFRIIEKLCTTNLQNYFKFIFEGRSIQNNKNSFRQIGSEPDIKIGFLSKNERDLIIDEIENDFNDLIKGTSIEILKNEFKEIGTNYQQVIILIS